MTSDRERRRKGGEEGTVSEQVGQRAEAPQVKKVFKKLCIALYGKVGAVNRG